MRRLLCCVVLVLFSAGCPRTDVVKTKFDLSQDKGREALLQMILKQRAPILSLEGRAKLRLYQPGKRRRTFRLFYMMKRPSQMYLEIKAALQQPALIVTSDGKRFAFNNLLQKQFLLGPAQRLPALLKPYLPDELPLTELIRALLGDPPVWKVEKRTWTREKKLWRLNLKGKGRTQDVWVDAAAQQIIRTRLDWKNKPTLTLEYGGFRGKPALPRAVRFAMKSRGLRVHWIFLEQKRNPKLPDKNFKQEPPKGVPVRRVLSVAR